ncbi:MAG: glycosyltransferase, partial [Treponema sp.]|nr:glycosyltransferase [Treponema sp.]
MKIGIDTFACNGGKSAVGVYLSQLLKRIPPSGENFELFGWEFDRFAYTEVAPDMEFIAKCSINGRTANSIWHVTKYPDFARKRAWNACFFPAAHKCLPNKSPCPSIGAVHDMTAWWGSRRTKEQLGVVLRVLLPNALRHLDRIIAVSGWVKEELMDLAGIKESRIDVVP